MVASESAWTWQHGRVQYYKTVKMQRIATAGCATGRSIAAGV